MTSGLTTKYSESRLGIGLDFSGNVLELFASPQGSWSILVTFPDGRTCMVSSGEDWQPLTIPKGKGT